MTKVRILCDNNISRMDFLGEHGFSALIDHGDKQYLLDTGQGHTLPHNVKSSGVELRGLEAIVLSHGHFDHTGGLGWVLGQMGSSKIIAHPDVFTEHLARLPNDPHGEPKYIGSPRSKKELEELGATFDFRDETCEIAPGFHFIAGYHRDPSLTPGDTQLVVSKESNRNELFADPIAEDANLLLETDSGPVLVLGCAHGGVLNVMAHVKEKLGFSELHTVLGGTHLMFYGPEQIQAAISTFEEFQVKMVAVSHCTGPQAAMTLAHHFKDRFQQAAAGSVFEF